MLTLQSVLCPTDFSEVSVKAEAYATDAGAPLRGVAAPAARQSADANPRPLRRKSRWTRGSSKTSARPRWPISPPPASARAPRACRSKRRSAADSRPAMAPATGQKARPDLVVIGARGGVEHLLLGSVTEKVMRKAPCAGNDRTTARVHEEWGLHFSRILCPRSINRPRPGATRSPMPSRSARRDQPPGDAARSTRPRCLRPGSSVPSMPRNTSASATRTPGRCCATPSTTTSGRGAVSTSASPPASRASASSMSPPTTGRT